MSSWVLWLVVSGASALVFPRPPTTGLLREAGATLLAITTAVIPAALPASEGFETFAAEGGVMEARPSCFMNECGAASRACFTNPSCLKGVTCLGRCRGEQLCATRCFARFGSEKLNTWLSCTLEEKTCVTTGVAQDTSGFYGNAPKRQTSFDPAILSGKWWKAVGYSPKYDCMACQKTSFDPSVKGQIMSAIEFRVQKEMGEGFWQNNLVETLRDDRGPQGTASFTVGGKMYGLTFREQWYVLDSKPNEYVFVAYKGDTIQGPYDGAFVFTKEKDAWDQSPSIRSAVAKVATQNAIDPDKFCRIDNACPSANVDKAGASASEQAREKLSWRDVFELTEWFRPGTIPKSSNFDPSMS